MSCRWGILAAFALLFWPAIAWTAPLPKPTHTSKTRFRIPFKFDANALKQMKAREIQLHVSPNRGQTWELAQVLPPDGGKFEYSCSAEGEYWFAVKTLDGQNQLHPPRGTYETGLVVIVDTTDPQLDLSVQQTDGGKIQLRWRATDTNLDIDSLRIEYLAAGSNEWTLLDLAPRARGETAWQVTKTGVVSVRGSIADFAGNSVQARAQTDVDSSGDPASKQRPIPQGKIASGSHDESRQGVSRDHSDSLSAASIPDPAPGEAGTEGPLRGADAPALPEADGFDRLAMKLPRPGSDPIHDSSAAVPLINHLRLKPAVSSPTASTVQQNLVSQRSKSVDSSAKGDHDSYRLRYVNSKHFQLGYKLDDIGPSGVGAVELYITENYGKKWWKYGDDPDRKSPFDVDVPDEQKYGFAIRVRSGAGLSIDPPRPDEPPAIVICVDQTPPQVELLPLQLMEQRPGLPFHRVLVRWRISEAHPSDKPVSLYYAAKPTGPWELISHWKEDQNSEYQWTLGKEIPNQFYLRLMVQDAAGNITQVDSTMPMTIDSTRPSASFLEAAAGTVTGSKQPGKK